MERYPDVQVTIEGVSYTISRRDNGEWQAMRGDVLLAHGSQQYCVNHVLLIEATKRGTERE